MFGKQSNVRTLNKWIETAKPSQKENKTNDGQKPSGVIQSKIMLSCLADTITNNGRTVREAIKAGVIKNCFDDEESRVPKHEFQICRNVFKDPGLGEKVRDVLMLPEIWDLSVMKCIRMAEPFVFAVSCYKESEVYKRLLDEAGVTDMFLRSNAPREGATLEDLLRENYNKVSRSLIAHMDIYGVLPFLVAVYAPSEEKEKIVGVYGDGLCMPLEKWRMSL